MAIWVWLSGSNQPVTFGVYTTVSPTFAGPLEPRYRADNSDPGSAGHGSGASPGAIGPNVTDPLIVGGRRVAYR